MEKVDKVDPSYKLALDLARKQYADAKVSLAARQAFLVECDLEIKRLKAVVFALEELLESKK